MTKVVSVPRLNGLIQVSRFSGLFFFLLPFHDTLFGQKVLGKIVSLGYFQGEVNFDKAIAYEEVGNGKQER